MFVVDSINLFVFFTIYYILTRHHNTRRISLKKNQTKTKISHKKIIARHGLALNGNGEPQVDMLDIPGKGRCCVFIARFSYDPPE